MVETYHLWASRVAAVLNVDVVYVEETFFVDKPPKSSSQPLQAVILLSFDGFN